jgi:hypothetical protein
MNKNEIIYSLEGHNSKYGVCEHRCQNRVWVETKNCCCGPEGDDWHNCGSITGFPLCVENNEGLIVYTNCYRKND